MSHLIITLQHSQGFITFFYVLLPFLHKWNKLGYCSVVLYFNFYFTLDRNVMLFQSTELTTIEQVQVNINVGPSTINVITLINASMQKTKMSLNARSALPIPIVSLSWSHSASLFVWKNLIVSRKLWVKPTHVLSMDLTML